MFLFTLLIIPQVAISKLHGKLLHSVLLTSSSFIGNFLSILHTKKIFEMYKKYPLNSNISIYIFQKISMIIFAILASSPWHCVIISFIFFTLHSISNKLWIEILRSQDNIDKYRQLAAMYMSSYAGFIVFNYFFKKLIQKTTLDIFLFIFIFSSFTLIINILLFSYLKESLQDKKYVDEHAIKNDIKTNEIQDIVKQSKFYIKDSTIFRIIFTIGGFAVTMSTPIINNILINQNSSMFVDFMFYKHIGLFMMSILVSYISIESIPNVLLPMLGCIPIFFIISINYINYYALSISSLLYGAAVSLSQITWHSSAIVFSKYKSSINFTRQNNLILAIRGGLSLFLGYILSYYLSYQAIISLSLFAIIIAAVISFLTLKKIK